MTFARIKYPNIFQNKSKRQIEEVLDNIYNDRLKNIAKDYYLYEECQIDIAYKYNIDRRTVEKYLKKAISELEHL